MMVLPRNTPDISTYCHQVMSLSILLKIYQMLTLSAFLQYFAVFCSISQHFLENLGASMDILKIYKPKLQFQRTNLCQQLLAQVSLYGLSFTGLLWEVKLPKTRQLLSYPHRLKKFMILFRVGASLVARPLGNDPRPGPGTETVGPRQRFRTVDILDNFVSLT